MIYESLPTGDALVTALAKRHPHCTGEMGAAWWSLLRDAYEGAGGFRANVTAVQPGTYGEASQEYGSRSRRASYLTRYPREHEESYLRRIDSSAYYNYVAPCIDTYASYLARKPASRTTGSAELARWWADVDGRGHSVAEWMPAVAQGAQLFGWCAVVVDRPVGTFARGTVKSVARVLAPEELADWQLGDDGAFAWARLVSRMCERDPLGGEEIERETYTIWTREEWARVDLEKRKGQWHEIAREGAPHTLGIVPIAVLRWQASTMPGCLYGVSQVDAVVAANLDLFNVISELREHIRSQVFGIFCVQASDASALQNLKLGTNNGVHVEPEMAFPQFVAPPESIAMTLEMRASGIVAEIYRAAKLEQPKSDSAGQGQDARSGVARAYDFHLTNRVLGAFARNLATVEWELAEIVARWDGMAPGAIETGTAIEYPDGYDIADVNEELASQFTILDRATGLAPVIAHEARERVWRAMNPEASTDDDAEFETQEQAIYDAALAAFAKGASGRPKDLPFEVIAQSTTLNEAREWLGLPARADGDVLLSEAAARAGKLAPANPRDLAATIDALPTAAPGDLGA